MLKIPDPLIRLENKEGGLKTREKILCIRRDRLPEAWMARTAVHPMPLSAFVDVCTRAGHQFVDRAEAEQDARWQQVIPYVVLQTRDQDQTAVYLRKGSETRLHDLWSSGIGGHIDSQDRSGSSAPFRDILMSGMTRELDEELIRRPEADAPVFCGIINEMITEVGQVHLGAVFQIKTDMPDVYVPGPELARFHWMATRRIFSLNMELWSCLALDLLGCRIQQPGQSDGFSS
jgi:predicted NUDIX family phosphoesterase